MDVCSKQPHRTAPVEHSVPQCSRANGWSWPPHPFQLLAWTLYVFFTISGFGVFVPLLPQHWVPAGYICTGVMFVCHLCVHVMAVSVDPADHNVRKRRSKEHVPVFDRSQHTHVIENCHCYLCQVDVGPKSKHCSACNKCVSDFDHHCRWLNNCVGGRNYRLFLHSVVSALIGVFLVLVLSSYVFIEFFIDPTKLRSDTHFLGTNDSGEWFLFLPAAPLSSTAPVVPSLAAVSVALSLISCLLLAHLLCFHLYLMWNRLSTYEYIVRQRHRVDGRERTAVKEPSVLKDTNYSGTLGYTNPQLDLEESVTARAEPELLANGTVRRTSSPIQEVEALPTVMTSELKGTTCRHAQRKKKRRVHRAAPHIAPPPDTPTGSVSPPPQPLLCPPLVHVQPAAPPADYHSDSAESLEEIPVALAKLGSSSSQRGGVRMELRVQRSCPRTPAVFVSRGVRGGALPGLGSHS
ncbi:palmitoyltransferase ZDHHC1 [Gouania willdenowi]|uniref:palmitoyltransferase ZDHHC1 n=1 Tax=Gouania willdenowi TaxID=441366 RepID=UPI001054F30B|nr:probable palmitoyltransferase ZDHHC1 [Gouania willdenowi]